MTIASIQVVPSTSNESSGPSYSVVNLCRSLQVANVATTLVNLDDSLGACREIFEKTFPVNGYPARLGRSPQMREWLEATVASGNVDIIHNHSLWMMPNVYACNSVKGTDVPLVVSPRGTLSQRAMSNGSKIKKLFWPLIQRPALAHVSCFHATAMSEYDDIRRMGFKQPVAVIPNGIDIPDQRQPQRSNLRTLLYLGRIHPIKGLDMLLPAWAAVQNKYPEWQLRVVGPDNGGYLAEVRALATQLNLDRVEFTGPLVGDEKAQAYADADLFVLPTYSENFGMTVAEALAAGTPAIVTKGAPWGGLNESDAGWWIDIDKGSLIDCLESALLKPRAQLDAMGLNGRHWMERDFAWENVANIMKATYDWLLNDGPSPECVITD
ncbi:MAG: glycosyltransferase [Porticoccaceae bacterium]|nr:glycosyltransferase [Porticoccaceae bacterium]